MELVRRIYPVPKDKNGKQRPYAVFLCPFCNREVERIYQNGIRQASCGCEHKRNIELKRQKRLENNEGKKLIAGVRDRMLEPNPNRGTGISLSRPRKIYVRRDSLFQHANKNCKKCKGTGYVLCSCTKTKKRMSNLHKFILKYASPACIKCLGTGIISWESKKRGIGSKIENPVICDCVVKHLERGGGLAIGLTAEKTLKLLGVPADK